MIFLGGIETHSFLVLGLPYGGVIVSSWLDSKRGKEVEHLPAR
jgi:hypothetical protein